MRTGRRVRGGRRGFLLGEKMLTSDFGSPFQALTAQNLLYLPTVLHDLNFVKVRPKGAPSRLHGEAAIVSKSRRLATVFTFRHRPRILSSIECSISSGANLTTQHLTRSYGSIAGASPT
jgi:hypothetical protein